MSKTYFIRHGSQLDIDENTMNSLWSEDRIAIHFPHDNVSEFEHGDSISLDSTDYSGSASSSLKRLHELANFGGYVFATYRGISGGKIGYVMPNSSIDIFHGRWGHRNGLKGRQASLKSIRLTGTVRNLSSEEAISLTAVQPRQGTFCRWHKIGGRVAALADGASYIELGSLTPDQQEVMCMEYLRTTAAKLHGLPVLRSTLMPVGRTMKDIDILGIAESGNTLIAQVTYSSLTKSGAKLKKLDAYRSQGNDTIYFCRCDTPHRENGHFIFPLQYVFDEFCIGSKEGSHWLKLAMGV